MFPFFGFMFQYFGFIPVALIASAFYMSAAMGNLKAPTCGNKIRHWLKKHDYKFDKLSFKLIAFKFGFNFDRTAQPTFKVIAINKHGDQEVLWFTFGTWLMGMFSNKVQVYNHKLDLIWRGKITGIFQYELKPITEPVSGK